MSKEHFSRFPSIQEFLVEIRNEFYKSQRPANEVLLDETDLCNYLKISKRHAANLRAKRLITYSKSGGRIYYRLSDILKFIELHEVKSLNQQNRLNQSTNKI